ncbi:hypothetical protein AXX16_3863 [Serratia rubidaea]|nr:hypothetical protein AXX16_3863 [Serratia rubidaea]
MLHVDSLREKEKPVSSQSVFSSLPDKYHITSLTHQQIPCGLIRR